MRNVQVHHEHAHARVRQDVASHRQHQVRPEPCVGGVRWGVHLWFDGEWVWIPGGVLIEAGIGLLVLGMLWAFIALAR